MSDDPEATRRRLAKAQSALDADPDNQELVDQVRRLTDALAALEDFFRPRAARVFRVLLELDVAKRRN